MESSARSGGGILLEHDELFGLLTEHVLDFIRLHQLGGQSVYASRSVERLYGGVPETMFEFAHPDDLQRCQQWWQQLVFAPRGTRLQWRVRDREGKWVWLETKGSLVDFRGEQQVLTVCRDVTEWMDAEERLRAANEHLQKVLDTIPVQIWSGPADGTLDYCNRRWRDFSGLGAQEIRGDGWQQMLHPDDRERVVESWCKSVAEGTPYEREERHRAADGSYVWFLCRGLPLRDPEGRILRWYGANTNIEDRKRAEEALRLFRALLDRTTDAIEVIDPRTGRLLDVNETACRYHGYTREEYLALTIPELTPTMPAAEWSEAVERVRQAGTIRSEGEHRRKDGSVFPVQVTYVAGAPDYVIAVVRDVTERKQAEKTLRESEGKLARAQRLAQIGYWENDFAADRVSWSEETGRILGLPPEEQSRTAAGLRELVHPEDRALFDEALTTALQGGADYHVEFRVVRPDQEVRYVHTIVAVTKDDAGRPQRAFGATQDITERKWAEDALRKSERRLNEAQRIAHLGHWEEDLRTGRITASDETYRIFGLRPQQNLRSWESWLEHVHPSDRETRSEAVERATRHGSRYEAEYRVIRERRRNPHRAE
jgi:PAS domain S-box-containing protein